jgi:glutathione S-transferase
MIRLYRLALSTNVERVTLALAYKGLQVESVEVPYEDRSEVVRVSGQELVPVIQDGPRVVIDSMVIVRYLEETYPDAPRLFPSDPARRAEVDVFIDWFNRVWKRPPNAITIELEKPEGQHDAVALAKWEAEMRGSLDQFETMLTGRDHLMGEFGAADVAAFPFLKYAVIPEFSDRYLFHTVLSRYLKIGDRYPRLAAWIARVDRRPRA